MKAVPSPLERQQWSLECQAFGRKDLALPTMFSLFRGPPRPARLPVSPIVIFELSSAASRTPRLFVRTFGSPRIERGTGNPLAPVLSVRLPGFLGAIFGSLCDS